MFSQYVNRTFGGAADEGTTLLLTCDHQDNLPGNVLDLVIKPIPLLGLT